MKPIPESTIENILAALEESPSAFEEAMSRMQQQQPVVYSYLFSEQFQVLLPEEREYLLYLALVIWKSMESEAGPLPVVTEEQLGETEENIWEQMLNARGNSFHQKADAFFENYPQEDLLAFVEDALAEDDAEETMEWLTREGRESIFVSLKSIIDCLAGEAC